MTDSVLSALYALILWWLTTGLILYAIRRLSLSRSTIMLAATAVSLAGFAGIAWSSNEATPLAAGVAFTSALLVWTWHEVSFLTGLVTGPRTTPAPAPTTAGSLAPRAPLRGAIETLLYHELAIVVSLAAVVFMTIGGVNWFGLLTFAILWVMRLSAKLNLYLGVPNLGEAFLPPRLAYLETYFCRRPMNFLFPVSVTAATAATLLLASYAVDPQATSFETVGYALSAALLALAVVEHWFMVLPFQATALWTWGLPHDDAHQRGSSAERHANTTDNSRTSAAPAVVLT
ncbi:MAG: putative photosynthetic complex assembly protein PuhE [Hyphomicrobiaceae bacterium]